MYDDEEDDDEEEAEAVDLLAEQNADAQAARGKDERTFYDDLAKKEDERHNAMRVDMQRRSLAVGELRQKLRHKEAELHALEMQISAEEERIDLEKQNEYRRGDEGHVDGAPESEPTRAIPILTTRDIDEEFSVERAEAHIKRLQDQKLIQDKELREMLEHMHEEERALSQMEHQLVRM